jgi:hypothetical protein
LVYWNGTSRSALARLSSEHGRNPKPRGAKESPSADGGARRVRFAVVLFPPELVGDGTKPFPSDEGIDTGVMLAHVALGFGK